ncbi:MAG: histidinol-phosphatase [Oscillospiraceae bacterium]|nr:histidinol-phosphatase [Candidatus Ruminococcus equi]
MLLLDYHIHTNFSDGNNSPEEMVQKAIEMGLKQIGICDHSYTFFDESYCIKKDKIKEYINTVNELKEKYKDKISILLGIEQDYYSAEPTDEYDYVIGSVHYVKKDGKYIPVDENIEILKNSAKELFGDDMYALVELYYETVADVVAKTNADIIGHFDLITKFLEKEKLFDENDKRYVNAYKSAVDNLIKYDIPFEINTGAISRGYRTTPYPSAKIREYITKKGGRFILSSDAHDKKDICFDFDKIEN